MGQRCISALILPISYLQGRCTETGEGLLIQRIWASIPSLGLNLIASHSPRCCIIPTDFLLPYEVNKYQFHILSQHSTAHYIVTTLQCGTPRTSTVWSVGFTICTAQITSGILNYSMQKINSLTFHPDITILKQLTYYCILHTEFFSLLYH